MPAMFLVASGVLWIACAAVIFRAAVRSRHDPDALRAGRVGVGVLYLGGGAAANLLFLVLGEDYAGFADGSVIAFVRHTWDTLVVPNHHAWISLLIVFELAVGVLALLGARCTQIAYAGAIAFHVALLAFGPGYLVWCVPMIAALTTLLEGERDAERRTVATRIDTCVA